jgi:hypothetical protein
LIDDAFRDPIATKQLAKVLRKVVAIMGQQIVGIGLVLEGKLSEELSPGGLIEHCGPNMNLMYWLAKEGRPRHGLLDALPEEILHACNYYRCVPDTFYLMAQELR